jgi:hypothetical protein
MLQEAGNKLQRKLSMTCDLKKQEINNVDFL